MTNCDALREYVPFGEKKDYSQIHYVTMKTGHFVLSLNFNIFVEIFPQPLKYIFSPTKIKIFGKNNFKIIILTILNIVEEIFLQINVHTLP